MTNPTTKTAAQTRPEDRYTAVVYFHGMGNQRRYEEVSSLINQLDNLVYQQRQPNHIDYLDLRPIALEQGRRGSGLERKSVAYYEVRNPRTQRGEAHPDRSPTVRFYESYWADRTAGGTNAFSTLNWVIRQWRRPLTVLLAGWGEVWTLRVGTLYGMYEEAQDAHSARDEQLPSTFLRVVEYLIDAYTTFVEPDSRYDDAARNCYRGNSFSEFQTFLRDNLSKQRFVDPDTQHDLSQDVLDLAVRWRETDRRAQLFYLLLTVTLVVAAGAVGLLGLWIVYMVGISLLQTSNQTIAFAVLPLLPFKLTAGWLVFVALLLALFGLGAYAGIKTFLSDYMGDVHQYLTYQETDTKYARREAILGDSTALMRHIMLDDRCERIVVVAHSLGSVIAYDTLLALRRLDWVQRSEDTPWSDSLDLAGKAPGADHQTGTTLRLDKIKHFVTMGSPIDKAIYFFAAVQSKIPRFVQTVYTLRGNISQPPFTWREMVDEAEVVRPHIHWVNYWDAADVISGPIRNIVGSRLRFERVDNVRVAAYWVPEPSRSHGGYFDHRLVLQDMFDMIFVNKFSFVDAANRVRHQHWFAEQDIYRKDEASRRLYKIQRMTQQSVVIIGALLLIVALVAIMPSVVALIGGLLVTFGVLFVVGQVVSRLGNGVLLRPRCSVDPNGPPLPATDLASPEDALESLLEQPLPNAPQPAPAPVVPPDLEVPPDTNAPPLPSQPVPIPDRVPDG